MLSYEYEAEPTKTQITGYGGLLPYVDLACVLGVLGAIDERVGVCGNQGWMDRQYILALMLLNLAGGECVEDIGLLEADAGLCRIVRQAERWALPRGQRRQLNKRFRKERSRTFPSPTRLYEYLNAFHDPDQDEQRTHGQAFIPAKGPHLEGLEQVNRALMASVQRYAPTKEATLDTDATIQETHKRQALYCYKGYRAYQPLSVRWAETGLMVRSEFRDGNVPAGYDLLRVLKEALEALPEGIERVRVRSDTAGYQHDVLRFMATGDEGQRQVIEFTVSCDVTPQFRQAVTEVPECGWRPVVRRDGVRHEWAEVVYVPNKIAYSKRDPTYRYLAIRERLEQGVLEGMEPEAGQLPLPFATVVLEGRAYRLSGIVTNRDEGGEELIHWHWGRCGKSEEAHAIMKGDLAGGQLPSGRFGANAAWWGIVVLAYNLHMAMQMLALPAPLTQKRMKALRFALIALPARLVQRGRQLFVRIKGDHPALGWLWQMRRKISALAPAAA